MVRLLLIPDGMIKRLATALLTALSLLLLAATSLPAQTLDPASAEALAATLRMLADPAARGQILATDPTAAAVDRQVQGMAGSSQLAQEVYASRPSLRGRRGARAAIRGIERGARPRQVHPAGFAALLRPEPLDRLRPWPPGSRTPALSMDDINC